MRTALTSACFAASRRLTPSGLEAQEHEKKRFFDLADRLASSSDGKEQQRLKKELSLLTFGEDAEDSVDQRTIT